MRRSLSTEKGGNFFSSLLQQDQTLFGLQNIFFIFRRIQAQQTRDYLKSVKQDQIMLPDGPLLLNPESLIKAFHRYVWTQAVLWSVVLFLSSLRESSPFGRVMRIHASARGFAAHSRVPSQLASLSIIGGFARRLFPQDLINPEEIVKDKMET